MLGTDHPHEFSCGQYNIHILSGSGALHIRKRSLSLLGYAGHDGDTADIIGINPFLLCKISLRHGTEHLLGGFCRGQIPQILRILLGHEAYPAGTAGGKHGPCVFPGITQPLQQFVSLFHNRQIRCEVGIKYIVKTDALQRCHHFALGSFLRIQSQFLSPCGSYRRCHLDYCDLLGIRQCLESLVCIVPFPQCSGRTMGNTLSTQCTVGAIDGLIIRHIYCGTGPGVLYIPDMHGLDFIADLYTAHTFNTFSGIPDQRERMIPGCLGNFLGKRYFQNSQIVGNLL